MQASRFSCEAGSMRHERDLAWAANPGSGQFAAARPRATRQPIGAKWAQHRFSRGTYRAELRDHSLSCVKPGEQQLAHAVALSQRTIE
jgi:hypothetical protein